MTRWMTMAEAARYCCLSEVTLRRAIKAGTLKPDGASGEGGHHRLSPECLDKWLQENAQGQRQEGG